MTVLERNLLESLTLVQPEVVKMAAEIEELTEKLKQAREGRDVWYRSNCSLEEKIKNLEAEITTLKAQKKEQEAATSDSSNNLKEVI